MAIELHDRLVRRDDPLHFDVDTLMERADEVTIAGHPALLLRPGDLLLHQCLHFFHDSRSRHPSHAALMKLVDIAELLRQYDDRIDWPELDDFITMHRLGGRVVCALQACDQVIGSPAATRALVRLGLEQAEQSEMDLFIERRVLRESPWLFHELVEPHDYRVWNEIKSALGRLMPYPSELRARYESLVPFSELLRKHLADVGHALASYGRRPRLLREDLHVYRWLSSLYHGNGSTDHATR